MPNKGLGEKIKVLRELGFTYNEIQAKLGCSTGTISYHLGYGQKDKTSNRQKARNRTVAGAIAKKTHQFKAEIPRSPRLKNFRNPKSSAKIASTKVGSFCQIQDENGRKVREHHDFSFQDVLDKFKDNPICYLTGETVDLADPREYEFDHIIPRSLGGDNSLDNLGITTRAANRAKANMTVEDFVTLCRKVVEHYDRLNESRHS